MDPKWPVDLEKGQNLITYTSQIKNAQINSKQDSVAWAIRLDI